MWRLKSAFPLQALLERLEDKFSLMEALESSPDLQEPKAEEEMPAQLLEDSDVPQPEPRFTPSAPQSYRDTFLKKLRGLQAPKMMRDSGCFGRRIDRIGSLSGMGCNGESPYNPPSTHWPSVLTAPMFIPALQLYPLSLQGPLLFFPSA